MAAIDEKIDVYKLNRQVYDEECLYTEETGAVISGFLNYYGYGYMLGYDIEIKFQVPVVDAVSILKSSDDKLGINIVKLGSQYYWQVNYYNGSPSTYTYLYNANNDKHVFKATKDGEYYLDGNLMTSYRASGLSATGISVFNSGKMKIFYVKYTGYNADNTSWQTTPSETHEYIPCLHNGEYVFEHLEDGVSQGYLANSGTGTVLGEINSSSLDYVGEMNNTNFESVKSVEAISVLGDELVYNTLNVIAKDEATPDISVNQILFDGSQYALFDSDLFIVGTNMNFYVKFALSDLETPWQGIIGFAYNFLLAYTGTANSYKYCVSYINSSGDRATYYLNVTPDNQEHTFQYTAGSLKYDGVAVLNGITLQTTSGTTASIGRGILKGGNYYAANFRGSISRVFASNNNGSIIYNATPYAYEGEYCFRSTKGSTIRYYGSRSGTPFNAEIASDIVHTELLEAFPYGSLFEHYVDNALIGKYYVEQSKRTGKRKFQYDCFSEIGLLDRQYYTGNLFHGELFSAVVTEILSGSGISFTVEQPLSSVAVYGHIPYGTKRDALRQLLFVTNAHVFRDANQDIVFGYIDYTEMLEIPIDRVFGNGSVEYPKLATKVTVVEHSYYVLGSEEENVLFDNTQGQTVSNQFVVFDNAPVIPSSLVTTGSLIIVNSGVNFAVVSGQGKLSGKPYTHITQNVERKASSVDREEYEVTVTDATLVSAVNSENVADRVADYYFNRYIAKVDIKVLSETCGHPYSFMNAFKEESFGVLSRMQKVFSSFIRASCEFICGLSDIEEGNNYNSYALINTNISWTVPEGVERIRVTLIGGGQGGSSGLKGASANGKKPGVGGAAGTPGQSGNVYVVTLEVSPGDVLSFSIGLGGQAGAICNSTSTPNQGGTGSSTTMTYGQRVFSSNSGSPTINGVVNIFTEEVYARPGEAGISGSPGGQGGQGGLDGGENGSDGESASLEDSFHSGGTGGIVGKLTSPYTGRGYSAGGGAGGGASATANGENGANGTVTKTYDDDDGFLHEIHYETVGGIGGEGADGGERTAATGYGYGGDAGHGGGGAGGRGVGTSASYSEGYEYMTFEISYDMTPETNAEGGKGGAGGQGANGCALIYYLSEQGDDPTSDIVGIGEVDYMTLES